MEVDLDATGLATGPLHSITNPAALGGVFQAVQNGSDIDPQVISLGGNGTHAMMFSGNCLQHLASVGGGAQLPPAGMVGASPTFSVEAWAYQSLLRDDESVVSWGLRGSCGANVSCSYGANGSWGGMAMWCNDRGWPGGPPPVGQWHHLVWTLSGGQIHFYSDGVEKLPAPTSVSPNINPNYNILIAAEHENSTSLSVITTILIGHVRIHSGVLTPSQVAANYSLEVPSYTTGTPVFLTAKPVHRYAFSNVATNDAVGLTVPDLGSVGGADGTVQGVYGSGSAVFSGNQLHLAGGGSGTAPYVDLPNGLLSSLSSSNGGPGQVTFEGWVTEGGNRSWARVFDFGEGSGGELLGPGGNANGTNYFTLIAQVGGDLNHSIIGTDGPGLNFGSFFLNNKVHFVATWDEASGTINIYQNGAQVAGWVLNRKFNSVTDVNNWLGRSNWTGDQNFQGWFDEFRIYTNVLSPGEVLNNYLVGPDTSLTTPGALSSIALSLVRTQLMTGASSPVSLAGNFASANNVNLTAYSGVTYSSSDMTVAKVAAGGTITAVAPGTATITASYSGKSDSKLLTVVAPSATLAHRYSFTDSAATGTDVSDSVGGPAWAGTVQNTAYTAAGQLYLDGVSAFAELPPGIVSNMDAVTIEAWASFNTLPNWAVLYAFGLQGSPTGPGGNMISFIPHSGAGDYRMSLNAGEPNGGNEQVAGVPGNLDSQANVHIAAVYNPLAGWFKLYTNGVLVAQNTNVTVQLTSVFSVTNWLGRSLWNDPYLSGSIDEFRVWNGVLTPDRIALDAASGPNSLLTTPGSLLSVKLNAGTTLFLNGTESAQFIGNFANAANVNLFAYDTPVFTSSVPSVVSVSANGQIKAVGLGSATLTAVYGGMSDSVTITVQPRPLSLIHRYSFTTDGTDSVGGAAWMATIFGGTFGGGQLTLNATTHDFVQFPAGLVTNLDALSVEAWASFGANANWCRLWDFGDINGTQGQNYFFLSPHSGPGDTFLQVRPTGFGPDETIEHAPILDNQTNVHIAAVVYPAIGLMQLYLNGFLAGQVTNATAPLSTIHDVYNYLGHSLFSSDAFLNGSIDEFRVYSGVMSAQQAALDAAAGPDLLVSNPGSLVRVRFTAASTNMLSDQTQQAQLFADFVNVSNVNLFAYASPAPTFKSSDTNVVSVTPLGLITAAGKGTATLTATYNNQNYTLNVQVSVTPLALKHHYDFSSPIGSTNVIDIVGGANGIVTNVDGTPVTDTFNGHGQLVLNGTNDFVALPSRLLSALSNATLEVWVTSTTLNNWSRVLDFGSSDAGPGLAGNGTNYLFLSPTPIIRFTTRIPGGGETPIIDDPSPLLFNQKSQIIGVYNVSAGVATLYVNGVRIGSGSIIMPLYQLNDENDWLGRSQFAGDPLFSSVYDDVRIWEGSFTAGEAAASYAAGSSTLPLPVVKIGASVANLTISWPVWASRYTLYHTATLGGAWTPVAATPVSDGTSFHVTLPQSSSAGFYRLAQ